MKKLLMLLCAVTLALGMMGSARADIIFNDDFARASYPQNTLGNGWTKTFTQNNDVQIRSTGVANPPGELWLRDISASATHQDSTVGFTNISLSFKWRGMANNEGTETLGLRWFDGTTTHDSGLSLLLTNTPYTPETYLFPVAAAGKSAFSFTFYTDDIEFNEAGRIRNVTLSGDIAEPVPEPATVALLGIGIAGLAGAEVRRRRKKKTITNG